MRKPLFVVILVGMLLTGTLQASAQKVYKLNRFVDSVLTVRYWRANIDTNYVTRPQTKWTLVGRFNVSGARIRSTGTDNGQHFETKLQADTLPKSLLFQGLGHLESSLHSTSL